LESLREMRILIVDDDKTFCQLLTEVLKEKGHDVDWTTHSLIFGLRKIYVGQRT